MAILGVDQGEGDAVEGEVPGGEPGILPLVGHGHHAQRVEVPPVLVADRACREAGGGQSGLSPSSQTLHVEEVDLLGPEQPGERLALDQPLVVGGLRRVDRLVELVGLGPALGDRSRRPRRAGRRGPASSVSRSRRTTEPPGGIGVEPIMDRGLGADPVGVDAVARRGSTWRWKASLTYGCG